MFIWAPLAATVTRNLPPQLAGAGSRVYNATRQVGSVLGSAGIAAFMTSRISAEMPGAAARPPGQATALQLPEFLREPFSAVLSQSMLLPAFVALFGIVAAMFMVGMVRTPPCAPTTAVTPTTAGYDIDLDEDFDRDFDSAGAYSRRVGGRPASRGIRG